MSLDRFDPDGSQRGGRLSILSLGLGCMAALTGLAAILNAAGVGLALSENLLARAGQGCGALVGISRTGEETLPTTDGCVRQALGDLRVPVTCGLDDLAQRGLGDHLSLVGSGSLSLGHFSLTISHRTASNPLCLAACGNHACGVRRVLGLLANGPLRADRRGRTTQGGILRRAPCPTRVGGRRARRGHGLVRAGDPSELGSQARDAFTTHIFFDGHGRARLDVLDGASPRLFGDDPRDEVLAQVSAQVIEVSGVRRGHENAHGDGLRIRVGDLHSPRAAVPQVGGSQELLDLRADQSHGGGPIELKLDRAQLGGSAARPVLEGSLREVAAGDDETALIPDAHDHIGERDLLDRTSLLLVAGDNDVAHADRVGEGQLQSGENVTEGLLGSETEDHGNNTRGGQDSCHDLAGGVEGSDHSNRANKEDDHLNQTAQNLGAGLEAARTASVGGLSGLRGVFEDPRGGVAHPRHAGQARDEEQVHEERRDR